MENNGPTFRTIEKLVHDLKARFADIVKARYCCRWQKYSSYKLIQIIAVETFGIMLKDEIRSFLANLHTRRRIALKC